jgi:hypothetical protein
MSKPPGRRTRATPEAPPADGDVPAEFARSQSISRKLAKVAPNDDPAIVAGAIVMFAADVIKSSSTDLREARAYLEGMRQAIDGLLVNAFAPSAEVPAKGSPRRRAR